MRKIHLEFEYHVIVINHRQYEYNIMNLKIICHKNLRGKIISKYEYYDI